MSRRTMSPTVYRHCGYPSVLSRCSASVCQVPGLSWFSAVRFPLVLTITAN